MKKEINLTIYTKEGKKWIENNSFSDAATIYKALTEDLLNKKIFRVNYITRITQYNRYDGFRVVSVLYDNGVKRVYTIYA